ncbi:MAG TPA: multicopper oxidase domain-containing protein, partial [Bacilli bacterium]
MNNIKKLKLFIVFGIITLFLGGCMNSGSKMGGMDHSKMNHKSGGNTKTTEGQAAKITTKMATISDKEFTLTAQPSNLEINSEITLPVWTFNNSVPGPEIRVKQGDKVKITLLNELPEPVSIHWHGVPVPNAMDGIPGITQNAVQPGKAFTYEFKAAVPGTYWYHSHQDSVNQVDKGLYGAFIVEAKDHDADRDYTLVLDEWMSSGMDISSMEGHDMSMMYDSFTVNGKSGDSIEKMMVKKGENVRIRLINAGFMSHNIHLHGHEFKVTATDGQPFSEPEIIKDQLIAIAPGERYDLEFEANNP